MAGIEMQSVVFIVLILLLFAVYQYNPSFFRFMRSEGFATVNKDNKDNKDTFAGATPADDVMKILRNAHGSEAAGQMAFPGKPLADITNSNPHNNPVPNGDPQSKQAAGNELKIQPGSSEGFADLSSYEGPASFGAAEAPAGCYPRDQLTPAELLPKDMNSIWAEQNPMGPGSLKGKNFLSAGALIGVNTVGQSLRNANLQIRSEPPNPQVPVSIFLQSTIGPDISHRSLEIN
jgi:hypothetical protein